MKLSLIALATFALSPLAHARTVTIETEDYSYPSPATTHFSLLQGEIAHKAIEACGGEAKVAGIKDLRISVSAGGGNGADVGKIEKGKFDLELSLFYPLIKSTATVDCRE